MVQGCACFHASHVSNPYVLVFCFWRAPVREYACLYNPHLSSLANLPPRCYVLGRLISGARVRVPHTSHVSNLAIHLLLLFWYCVCLRSQVQEYACLYTSHVSNLANFSPDTSFRAPSDLMPHDRDTMR